MFNKVRSFFSSFFSRRKDPKMQLIDKALGSSANLSEKEKEIMSQLIKIAPLSNQNNTSSTK